MGSCKFQLQLQLSELDHCWLQDHKDFSKENLRLGAWATGPEFQWFAPLLDHPITLAPGHQLILGFLLGGIRDC